MASDSSLWARSSIPRMLLLPAGTAITRSFVAYGTGASTSPLRARARGSPPLAARKRSGRTPRRISAAMSFDWAISSRTRAPGIRGVQRFSAVSSTGAAARRSEGPVGSGDEPHPPASTATASTRPVRHGILDPPTRAKARRSGPLSHERIAGRRRERVVAGLEFLDGQHDHAFAWVADPRALRGSERVGGVGRGAGVELVEGAVPQASVGIDHAAQPQGRDALLQAPRSALGRRPVAEQRAE